MSVYKIWSNSRLLEYGNYHPCHQGKTLDIYEEVETPKKGDYGVFRGPWDSWELRSLSFTKKGKLNGGQKQHAHYFVRKKGSEYFPTYGEIVPLCYVTFNYQSIVAGSLGCYNFFSLERKDFEAFYDFFSLEKNALDTLKELKTLCADFGVNLKYDTVRTQRKIYVHFFRNIEHCERRTYWNVANVEINEWLKGLKSFFPAIEETVRQGLIEREVSK